MRKLCFRSLRNCVLVISSAIFRIGEKMLRPCVFSRILFNIKKNIVKKKIFLHFSFTPLPPPPPKKKLFKACNHTVILVFKYCVALKEDCMKSHYPTLNPPESAWGYIIAKLKLQLLVVCFFFSTFMHFTKRTFYAFFCLLFFFLSLIFWYFFFV